MALNDPKSSSNSKINDPAPRGWFLCGYTFMHFMADTLKTLSKKTTPTFAFATTTKYGFDPSCFGFLGAFEAHLERPLPSSAIQHPAGSPLQNMRTSGSPLQEQSKDTKDAYLFSRTLFLSQTCLHFAVSLFKNPVSCSLVASIFSGLHLAPHQHSQISTRVFVLGEPSQSLFSWRMGGHCQERGEICCSSCSTG